LKELKKWSLKGRSPRPKIFEAWEPVTKNSICLKKLGALIKSPGKEGTRIFLISSRPLPPIRLRKRAGAAKRSGVQQGPERKCNPTGVKSRLLENRKKKAKGT